MSVCKHIGKDGICVLHSEPFYKEPCHEGPCNDYEAMDDLISRQAALDIINSQFNGWLTDDERLHLEGVGIGIKCLPTIDSVKHGMWEKISDRNYKCTCCNAWWSVDRDSTMKDFKHCPNCGAHMERNEE